MANAFRTKEMVEKYKAHRSSRGSDTSCELCPKEAIRTFTHWKATRNQFPYDLVSSVHDMIMPIRHVSEYEITKEEWEEFKVIKESFMQEYDNIIEGTHKTKSIPGHFHLHLIRAKEVEPNTCGIG